MATEKKSIDPNLLLVGGAGLLFYFGILDPVLKAIGIKDDAQDRADDQSLNTARNAMGWDPTYFQTNLGKGYKQLTADSAVFLADEIADSWGFFNDDEDRIYAAFRMIGDQFQLSQVVAAYASKHRADLLSALENGLSESEFLYIARLVNKLPAYRK